MSLRKLITDCAAMLLVSISAGWPTVSDITPKEARIMSRFRDFITISLFFGHVVIVVPVGVTGPADIVIVSSGILITNIRWPGIVDRNVIHRINCNISDRHHHVPAATVPVPGKCERLFLAVDLILDLRPTQWGVGRGLERKAIFIKLRPASINASRRRWISATISASKSVVRLDALPYVICKEVHHHFATGR